MEEESSGVHQNFPTMGYAGGEHTVTSDKSLKGLAVHFAPEIVKQDEGTSLNQCLRETLIQTAHTPFALANDPWHLIVDSCNNSLAVGLPALTLISLSYVYSYMAFDSPPQS